jgi:predicted nucleotidyltransferase
VDIQTNHKRRDDNLISERKKIKESIKNDLENDKNILAIFYGGSMARGNHDCYSDLDLRIVVKDEAYEEYRKNKKERAKRWGDVLFYEDFPWAMHTVAHYKSFVKVDAFYYKQEDLRPSHYIKEETQIEYDPYGIVTAVSEQSRELYYEPATIEFELWRSKFFAHMHEVYRRVNRGELYYALHSLDMMRWSVAAGWDMVRGRQPNAPGEWSRYEGERSPFDKREQELLSVWYAGRDPEEILRVMKEIVPEFKVVHSRLCTNIGLNEQAEWVDEIVNLVM